MAVRGPDNEEAFVFRRRAEPSRCTVSIVLAIILTEAAAALRLFGNFNAIMRIFWMELRFDSCAVGVVMF